MDNIKNDSYYAKQIVDNISAIKRYISNKTYEQFVKDEELIDAVMFRLIQLVENIKKYLLILKKNIRIYHGVK